MTANLALGVTYVACGVALLASWLRSLPQRIREHDERRADPCAALLASVRHMNDLRATQAQVTIDRMEATPTSAELLAGWKSRMRGDA
jgi:hypothetical protein